jgi:hypothetical protein
LRPFLKLWQFRDRFYRKPVGGGTGSTPVGGGTGKTRPVGGGTGKTAVFNATELVSTNSAKPQETSHLFIEPLWDGLTVAQESMAV